MADHDFTDAQLSAYLDGELDVDTRNRLDAALETNPVLEQRLAALIRIDDQLRPAFSQTLSEPVPERFEALLAASAPRRNWPSLSSWFSPRALASMTASLAVGLAVGTTMAQAEPALIDRDGTLYAGGRLAKALNQAAAGEDSKTRLGMVRVRLSFYATDQRPCRQFYLGQQEGVSCLNDEGWQVHTLAPSPVDVFAPGYQLASGDVAAPVDAALRQLGIADIIAGDDEAAAIDRNWQPQG